MQSGKFQHLLTIQRRIQSQSDVGELGDEWEPLPGFERIFGEVLPDRAQEFFTAQQLQATRNALVRLYYQPGITEQMRVVHHVRPGQDDYYAIEGVVHFQARQRELRLMCLWREAEGWRRGADLENAE
jgi:SPP1 family predicted phage head-tail adaptor